MKQKQIKDVIKENNYCLSSLGKNVKKEVTIMIRKKKQKYHDYSATLPQKEVLNLITQK